MTDWNEYTLRIGLAPGRGIDYFHDESGVLGIRIQGSNPTLVIASAEAFIKELSAAINTYREGKRDMLPTQSPLGATIEVDEEVHYFLNQKAKEGLTPNQALRYLLYGEAPPSMPDLEPGGNTLSTSRRALRAVPEEPDSFLNKLPLDEGFTSSDDYP